MGKVKAVADSELTIEVANARYEREHKARRAAESLIEIKTEQLLRANRDLEQVLTGSVRLMADVLAMAKPEVFQKAAKVQRWARSLAQHIQIDKPWELDIAAILYPIGIIPISDSVMMKYSLDAKLSAAEQQLIDESPLAAYRLVQNIPHMDGVARAILYSRKGFDGSGMPDDKVKGDAIPQAARVLKVLIDLADAATGAKRTREKAFMQLTERREQYDFEILKATFQVIVEPREEEEQQGNVKSLPPTRLRVGDVVHQDIMDAENNLLLAAGAVLSEMNIKRLTMMMEEKRLVGPITITRT